MSEVWYKENTRSSSYLSKGDTPLANKVIERTAPKITPSDFEQEIERNVPVNVRGKVKSSFLAGERAREEGRCDNAIEDYNNSIKEYPTASAYFKLGYCYTQLTIYDKAREALLHTVDLSEQRDIKPFKEVLNDELLRQILFKFRPVVEEITKEKGDFLLFGLFEIEGNPDQWYVVFSASWPDWDKDKMFDYFIRKLFEQHSVVSYPAWKTVIVPADPSEDLVKNILKTIKDIGEPGEPKIRSAPLRSYMGPIKRAYIIIPKQVVIMAQPSTHASPPLYAPKANAP